MYLSPGVGAAVADAIRTGAPAPAERLTPREREVLQLVAEGKTTKEIASDTGRVSWAGSLAQPLDNLRLAATNR